MAVINIWIRIVKKEGQDTKDKGWVRARVGPGHHPRLRLVRSTDDEKKPSAPAVRTRFSQHACFFFIQRLSFGNPIDTVF